MINVKVLTAFLGLGTILTACCAQESLAEGYEPQPGMVLAEPVGNDHLSQRRWKIEPTAGPATGTLGVRAFVLPELQEPGDVSVNEAEKAADTAGK